MLDKRAGEPCRFLRGDKLCALHADFGIESKPLACRAFPFRFVETPGGVYAALSFACTAVLENHGEPVVDRAAEVALDYALSPHRRAAPSELLLAGQLPLNWAQYESIEADLRALIAASAADPPAALRAQAVYLRLLTEFLREARKAAAAPPGERPEANDEPLAVFRRGMSAPIGDRPWGRLFRMANKRRGSPTLRRVALGYLLALNRVVGRRIGRARSFALVTSTYLRHAFGRGAVDIPGASRPVRFDEIARVAFDPMHPPHAELLARYFDHALFRKDLLRFDEIAFSHNMLLVNYGLIHGFAAGLAAIEGAARVESPHLIEGLRAVERQYVLHSAFANKFADQPMLRATLEGVFHRPAFPFSMTR
jgi:hypothetical protein